MPTLLRDNPDEYPQSYVQSASLQHVWNAATLEWDKYEGIVASVNLDIRDLNSATDSVTVTGTVTTAPSTSGTSTRTQVADANVDTLLLAANANRKGASITNTSSAILYLGLGTTAVTAANFTARMLQWSLYEIPFGFTGQVRGIWASDPGDGAAQVSELT